MKTEQKIYAALAVLALGAGGLYWTSQSKKEQVAKHSVTAASADLPSVSVPKDDEDKITKIELSTVDKDDKTKKTKVVLEKKGEDWDVTAPLQAKGSSANVKSLLDNLKDLKVKEIIDHTTGSYDQYELSDDKAVHVVAYKGADKAVDLYFGKSGSRGQMMRVGGKDGVFIADKYSSYLYTRDLKGWRDGTILKFEDANAIQVDVTNKNGQFSFSKNGEKWSGTITKRDKDGKLDKPEENGGVIHIKLKDNAGDLTVKVGKVSKGTSHWAMKDGSDILYAVSSWASDWATAEPTKFEKDDKKPGGAPPPHGMPSPMDMPGGMPPGMGDE